MRVSLGKEDRRAGGSGHKNRADSSRALDEARDLLLESIALDPEFAPAHRTLGLIYYMEEDWDGAARHLRIYLDLDTTAHDRAYLHAYLEKCETELVPNT